MPRVTVKRNADLVELTVRLRDALTQANADKAAIVKCLASEDAPHGATGGAR